MGASSHSLNTFCKTSHGRRGYKKLLMVKRRRMATMKTRRVLMKRNLSKPKDHGFDGKVQTLERLIPNHESNGLEGLFRETADYILALQMRVRVMQMMVDALEDGYNTTTTTTTSHV